MIETTTAWSGPKTERSRRRGAAWLRRARKLRVILTVTVYTVLSPFGYLFFWLLLAFQPSDPIVRARRLQRVTSGAYRVMHDWLRVFRIARFDHRGALGVPPAGPVVVVANHPTLMDVTAITAALGGGSTVAKPILFRRGSLHALMVGAGHIEGAGDDPIATGRVIDQAVDRLRHGLSVIIFPEGTRSPPRRLHPFGRAAFEIACRARVPVVSIGITCEPTWLSKEVPLFDPPHPMPDLRLETLATDDPASLDYDSRALRRAVEARFREWSAGRLASAPADPNPPTSL